MTKVYTLVSVSHRLLWRHEDGFDSLAMSAVTGISYNSRGPSPSAQYHQMLCVRVAANLDQQRVCHVARLSYSREAGHARGYTRAIQQCMNKIHRGFVSKSTPPLCTCYQEEDGDEDFEPPTAEEEEEGEEAGVRRRNIQARELSDLLQDAFTQVRPVEASTLSFFSILT